MKLARHISRRFTCFSTPLKPERVTKNPLSINAAKELHAHLIRTQRHEDPFSISPVIRAYSLAPSHLHKAHHVFYQTKEPTMFNFNHMIRGFSQSNVPNEAIKMYNQMYYLQGFPGDIMTFIFVFKACARVSDVANGQKFHVHAVKLGFDSYLFVANALIHMYSCCGDLGFARKVFDTMEERDIVSWNSLICGYSQCKKFKELLGSFRAMQEANVKADAVTMVKVILACCYTDNMNLADSMVKYIEENCVHIDVYLGNTLIDMYGKRGLVNLARELFDRMLERNVVSWNALIKGYMKVGDFIEARKVFDNMKQRDVISWTSMITGYSQANQFTGALNLFQDMMAAKVVPDEITVASVLSACANLGALDVGLAIHDYICKHGIRADVYVGNSLIDMYCKCGVVDKALEVFHDMKEKDSVSWTSVISGLAVNGFADSALEFFSQMLKEGVRPTHGCFLAILLACTHAGLVDKGLQCFETMEKVHGLTPEMKHYGCVVDLLGRYGYLERAYQFIRTMPIHPDVVVWRILLSACKLHGNVVLAEIVTNKLLELDPSNSGNYVLLSNTYASSDRWDDATKMRELMEGNNVQKPSGWSSIEAKRMTSSISGELHFPNFKGVIP
ncbi:PREDICTED: pentatricopeptide repeat-containing protein At2g29760, chloroplastic [Theobroma cacao]|uniref:Pentatricopeptide repeat-containing protein At2g29760, chloroplastic n=1 Tax=Theobroma cacao TaxID=3641 RepID=A0AB32W4D2_THECC|nr:PREDICTED: pentatricopeptide repeat-containing protein At2g29760, chloroplastic [Theobroma cacao]